jgi:peptidoglycan/xylan/chitin deacetylase (PgdA/CDA1 family)
VDWDSIVQNRLFHLMNPAEVAEVARRGVDIQLHTHRHRTPREKGEFIDEVVSNRRILEERTGRAATHFCYPSGDVASVFLPWLREVGVETATTTAAADLAGADDDPLLLPRHTDTMAQSEVLFEGWLSGAGALVHRRQDRLATR